MKVNGMKIKEIREGQGLSREALAIKAGVTAQAITHWEGGRIRTFAVLAKVADALGVDESAILETGE